MIKRVVIYLTSVVTLFFLTSSQVFAQNTTLEVNPQSGNQDNVFSVDVFIDGHGDKFNAAEAKVELNNLSGKDLTLGDCQFSFLKTPTKNDPSFSGILLSKYSEKCTVYSLNLIPIEKGEGSLTFSESSVKQYGDASELLTTVLNGEYILNTDAVALSETVQNTKTDLEHSDSELYIFNLKIIAEKENQPLAKAKVALKYPSGELKNEAVTNNEGAVTFEDLEPGIYMVHTEKDGKVLGENIINASGPNKRLSLNIKLQPQPEEQSISDEVQNNFSYPLIIVLIITSISLAFLIFKKMKR